MARILKDFIKSSKDFDSQYDDYIEDKNHEIELNPQYQYYYDDSGNLFQVPRDNSDLVDEFGLDQPMDLSYPPSDQECESWMQFLRELHDKREAERELERKEIYGNSKDKDDEDMSLDDSFEMPIEDVSFYNDNITGVAGRINTGHIKVGDSIDLNGKSYKISKINMFNKNLDEAQSGDNVEVLLEGLGRSGIRLDDSTKPNAKFAFAEYTKDTNGRLISPTQFLRSHKDMSESKFTDKELEWIQDGYFDEYNLTLQEAYKKYFNKDLSYPTYDNTTKSNIQNPKFIKFFNKKYLDKNGVPKGSDWIYKDGLDRVLSLKPGYLPKDMSMLSGVFGFNLSSDFSDPEKYSEEWFEKNNINPYTSIPARMANKALEAENEAWRKHSSSNEDKVYKDYFGKDPYHYWDALEKFPKPKRYRGTWAGPGYTNNKYERDRILKGIREVKSNKHKIINDYDTKYPNGYHLGPENGGFTNTGKKEYESELKEWTNRLRDYKLSQRPYFKKLKRLENQYESNLNDPKFKEYKKNLLGDYPLEVGNRAIAEQYKLAEQKGLVNPDQNIYTGTRYMKLPDGFKEVDGAHDYIVLAKPIDDHTIKEIEYDNGKKHERIIRPNSDSYYNDWYFDENGKMKDWLKVQKDMSSGTFYVNTLRNPNLFYPVEYKKNPFRKVKAVYRADQPNIGYDYDKILNDETDEEYNKYLPIHNQAINDITQINLKGITEDELNLAINELAKKYPNKRFEINVKYKDMSMLNGLFR